MIIATETKETRIKKAIRNCIADKLNQIFSEMPEFNGKVSRIKDGISIAVDDVEMENGEIGEVCVRIKPEVPDYLDKIDKHGEFIRAYERLKEEDEFIENELIKEEKAEKKRREKEEKKKRILEAKMERYRKQLEELKSETR